MLDCHSRLTDGSGTIEDSTWASSLSWHLDIYGKQSIACWCEICPHPFFFSTCHDSWPFPRDLDRVCPLAWKTNGWRPSETSLKAIKSYMIFRLWLNTSHVCIFVQCICKLGDDTQRCHVPSSVYIYVLCKYTYTKMNTIHSISNPSSSLGQERKSKQTRASRRGAFYFQPRLG